MQTNTLHWYFNRLLAMNPTELSWRVNQLVKKKVWKRNIPNYRIAPHNFCFKSFLDIKEIDKISSDDKNALIEEANQYLDHYWLFFNFQKVKEEQINWHRDPLSGMVAPMDFGFSINHRDEHKVGDIKVTWEKNRHHHLTILAIAFYITGDEVYADEVKRQLESWIEQNPYLIGVNWTHPLEQAIRLISWVFIAQFLEKSKCFESLFGPAGCMYKSIYEHQRFIVETYSRGSSANNHLIGEMAGLYIACQVFTGYPESEKWSHLAKSVMIKEFLRQTYESGINKELAFSYQIFVAEFVLIAYYFAKKNGDQFSKGFEDRLRTTLAAANQLTGHADTLPNYGDGDEGMAVQLQEMNGDRLSWLLEISNNLLTTSFETKTTNSLPSILLNCLKAENQKETSHKTASYAFEDAGIYVLSRNITGSHTVETIFDAGPLGYGSMAAHGHADALSFTLNINNIPVFVDPGTYCYHTDLKWRHYFKGTSAHNTLTVDGEDQSGYSGPFLWTDHAKCHNLIFEPGQYTVQASHDGYLKRFGVTHTRRISLLDTGINIKDSLEGSGERTLEYRFHLSPNAQPAIKGDEISISVDGIQLRLAVEKGYEVELIRAGENAGWFSPHFLSKVPCYTIIIKKRASLPLDFETKIKIDL